MIDVLARLEGVPGLAEARALGDDGVWVVGGAVRDALLGTPVRDLDLAVEGDSLAVARALGEVVEAHERFGTATVRVAGGTVNVARTRVETYAAQGALPDVAPAGLAEDLGRRDFGVNAIAVRLADGQVEAAAGALEDVAARRLRVLHARSFVDDPTRALRLARYAARLGLAVEDATARFARATRLDTVSPPRVGAELRLLLGEPSPLEAFGVLARLGLLREWTPDGDVARAALRVLAEAGEGGVGGGAARAGEGGVPQAGEARAGEGGMRSGVAGAGEGGAGGGVGAGGRLLLAVAALDRDPAVVRVELDGFEVEARDRDVVVAAAAGARALAEALRGASLPSEIAAAARRHPPEAVALAGALGAEEPARRWLHELRHVGLEITGDDLIAAGVAEGPAIGAALDAALAARLDGTIPPGRQAELRAGGVDV